MYKNFNRSCIEISNVLLLTHSLFCLLFSVVFFSMTGVHISLRLFCVSFSSSSSSFSKLMSSFVRIYCFFFSFVVSAIISFIHPLKQMTSSRLVYIDVDNNNNNRSHRSPVPNVACKAHQTKRDK